MKRKNKENYKNVLYFEDNKIGDDFVVGDIHGKFSDLENALAKINFRKDKDRLFCCGDLGCRGEQSHLIPEYLNTSWFFSVRGNHDNFIIRAYEKDPTFSLNRWYNVMNGGIWWKDLDDKQRYTIYESILKTPYAIEINYPDKSVGIVHADVPDKYLWKTFLNELELNNELIKKYATESRKRAKFSENTISRHFNKNSQGSISEKIIKGIDVIYVGHTVQSEPTQVGNICFIDTGSGYQGDNNGEYQYKQGKITIVNIKNSKIVY